MFHVSKKYDHVKKVCEERAWPLSVNNFHILSYDSLTVGFGLSARVLRHQLFVHASWSS
jgi:hypothetical protein